MIGQLADTLLASLSSSEPLQLLTVAVVVYFVAGVIKGTLGIGFPTAAVSLLAQVTDARTAITLVIMPMLITNLWQVLRAQKFLSVIKQMWLLISMMLILIILFSQLSSQVPVDKLAAVLGCIVALYALHSLFARPLVLNPAFDKSAQVVAGISAGIMGGLVSVWAPPILIYLHTLRMPKEGFISTVGVLLLLGTCVLLMSYVGSGVLTYGLFLCSSLLIFPSLLGFTIGEIVRKRISSHRFERLLLWFFFLMGLNLIRRALF
ncbi:MAG: sulfite exporter TauE/SafE family protein [Granulosicoccus sp.]